MNVSNTLKFILSNKLSNLKKLQIISGVLQEKILILTIRSTINNIYATIANKLGKIILVRSGGSAKSAFSKRNTTYSLELILSSMLKKVSELGIKNLILNLDFSSLKKKKGIIKVISKFHITVLGVHLNTIKAFNGVRLGKKRRV